MEVNSFQLSTIVTKSCIVNVKKGPNLQKYFFVWQKKLSNSIQKSFMKERVLFGNCKIIFYYSKIQPPDII